MSSIFTKRVWQERKNYDGKCWNIWKHSGHQHHHPDIPMSDAIQKPYTSYTCIKHVKAEGRFKGDFLIEWTSLIPLGLNKHRLNTCNYAIYKSRISRDRVLLISDRYYPWSSETKTFYIDLLNKWRHCSLTNCNLPLGKGIYKTQLSGEKNFEVVGTILLGVLIARRLFIRLYAQIRITQSHYCVDCLHILDQGVWGLIDCRLVECWWPPDFLFGSVHGNDI